MDKPKIEVSERVVRAMARAANRLIKTSNNGTGHCKYCGAQALHSEACPVSLAVDIVLCPIDYEHHGAQYETEEAKAAVQ